MAKGHIDCEVTRGQPQVVASLVLSHRAPCTLALNIIVLAPEESKPNHLSSLNSVNPTVGSEAFAQTVLQGCDS